ncbi:MAG: ATP-binding protein [Sorangiineae bacterium]|nr:ATP-binding protein [Polyangiaceae bacterium]MEB2322130.1 ATP-binding protein [Sorangiineae bacterium]
MTRHIGDSELSEIRLPQRPARTRSKRKSTRKSKGKREWPASPPEAVRGRPLRWLLRVLLRGDLLGHFFSSGCWPNTELCTALGVSFELADDVPPDAIEPALTRWLAELEAAPEIATDPVSRNLAWLAERLGLDPVALELLSFTVTAEADPAFEECFNMFRVTTDGRLHTVLPKIVAAPQEQVRAALGPTAPLAELGLVKLAERPVRYQVPLRCPDEITAKLSAEHASPDALLAAFFAPAAPTSLAVEDFAHVARELDVARRLLEAATAKRTCGVNVLIYGPPGTGKTVLARVLTDAIGARLFEVAPCGDRGGAVANSSARFESYALVQRFLREAPGTVLVFDELEDVFPPSPSWLLGDRGDHTGRKAWINRLLETNPVPTVWISNSVARLDPAFRRRFDLVIELRTPPARVRQRIIESETAGLPVGKAWIDATSRDERVRPATIARAARVARIVGATQREDLEAVLSLSIDGALLAEGSHGAPRRAPNDACRYDASFVNASVDIDSLVSGLSRTRRGTIAFHGVPGTGKSALAAHLAERLGVPLLVKRASDLLDPYLGMTEKNLAEMFREAKNEGALLFLDEADSFLQDRGRAQRSWEVTLVNELLVQMETFEGIFVCATNLMESLDAAAFRRFAIKVRFEPLRLAQRERMFLATLEGLGARAERAPAGLARLGELVPGDFAAVARRLRIIGGVIDAGRLLDELADELVARRSQPASIGFRS